MTAQHCLYCGQCSHGQCCRRCQARTCPRQTCHAPGASVISGSFCEYTGFLQITAGGACSECLFTGQARVITIFIKNVGEHPVTLHLQNSPNGEDFTDDPQQLELAAGQMGYLIPYIFSKYTRVAGRSVDTSLVCLWLQMQNHAYTQQPL